MSARETDPARRRASAAAVAAILALWFGGCAMTPTVTPRSSIEQRLIVRSLEQAVAKLDLHSIEGKRLSLDLHVLAQPADQAFAKAFVTARLRRRGLEILDDPSAAELRLEVFATALAVDQGETLIGTAATVVPFLLVPIPELALFKWTRHRGVTELQLYTYDRQGHLVGEPIPSTFARSRYDQYTVLIVIRWSTDTLGEPPD